MNNFEYIKPPKFLSQKYLMNDNEHASQTHVFSYFILS